MPPVGCEVKLSQVFLLHIVQQVARQCVRWPFSLQLEEDVNSVEVGGSIGTNLEDDHAGIVAGSKEIE